MGLTISQVRGWTLGDLTNTATGLRNGAATMSDSAVSIINRLAGIETIWTSESRDAVQVRSKDFAEQMQEKSKRWNNAAAVLDEAAEQMGLLRNAILDTADNPEYKQKYVISDDGNVELTAEYANTLTTQDAKDAADSQRANLETALRSLLATAELSGQYYDWLVTNALLDKNQDPSAFYTPWFPDAGTLPTAPKEDANRDGSGPAQYRVDHPGNWDKAGLQSTKMWAQGMVNGGRALGQTYAPDLLQHFLDGSGETATVPVDSMLYDMPWFSQAAQSQTRSTLDVALKAMPPGYTGPVAFQSDYSHTKPDGSPARASATSNPDWWAALGTFSYQTSGIAMPTADGNYSVTARTSVYDYYNYDPAGQQSGLNDLHRAGWAQNFDVVGSSGFRTSTYP